MKLVPRSNFAVIALALGLVLLACGGEATGDRECTTGADCTDGRSCSAGRCVRTDSDSGSADAQQGCDYDIVSQKLYASREPRACITLTCGPSFVYFSDRCGCGCERYTSPDAQPDAPLIGDPDVQPPPDAPDPLPDAPDPLPDAPNPLPDAPPDVPTGNPPPPVCALPDGPVHPAASIAEAEQLILGTWLYCSGIGLTNGQSIEFAADKRWFVLLPDADGGLIRQEGFGKTGSFEILLYGDAGPNAMWEVNLRDNLGSDHYMKLAFADGPRKLLLGSAVFAFSP